MSAMPACATRTASSSTNCASRSVVGRSSCPTPRAPAPARRARRLFRSSARPRADMTVAYVSDGNVNPAQGVRGGLAGTGSAQYQASVGWCAATSWPGCAEVHCGTRRWCRSAAAAADTGRRRKGRAVRVRRGRAEGWVSRARAESVYGVALTQDLQVDEEATARLRGG